MAVAVAGCVAPAAAPRAATPSELPEAAVAVLSRLRPGQQVRVIATGYPTAEGRFVAIRAGRLVVEDPRRVGPSPLAIPLAAAETVWVRGRATKKGAILGGAIGGLAGGVLGSLYAGAACDAADCGGAAPAGALVGLGAGGAVGALLGALIGAASGKWHLAYRAAPGAEGGSPATALRSEATAPMSEWLGSASLHLGYDTALDEIAPGGAAGGHVGWTAQLGSINPGFEIGGLGLGQRSVLAAPGTPLQYDESVFYLGPIVCFGASRGTLRPYALAGLGFYRWKAFDPQVLDPQSGVEVPTSTRDFLGGSIGIGVRVHATRRLSFELEGRWHANVSPVPQAALDEKDRRLQVLSLTAGAAFRW